MQILSRLNQVVINPFIDKLDSKNRVDRIIGNLACAIFYIFSLGTFHFYKQNYLKEKKIYQLRKEVANAVSTRDIPGIKAIFAANVSLVKDISNLSATPEFGATTHLQISAAKGDLEFLRLFLDANPSLLRDAHRGGTTLFHCAIAHCRSNTVEYLIQKGAIELDKRNLTILFNESRLCLPSDSDQLISEPGISKDDSRDDMMIKSEALHIMQALIQGGATIPEDFILTVNRYWEKDRDGDRLRPDFAMSMMDTLITDCHKKLEVESHKLEIRPGLYEYWRELSAAKP